MSQDMLEACRFYLEGVSKNCFFNFTKNQRNHVRNVKLAIERLSVNISGFVCYSDFT